MIYPGNFAINYEYNNFDDLVRITNASTQAQIWKLDEVNNNGQIKKATYGNIQSSYEYDDYNRLKRINVPNTIDFQYVFNDKQQLDSRTELYAGIGFKEEFSYDELNRLTSCKIGNATKSIIYNTNSSNNQIISKDSIGSGFEYNFPKEGYPIINSKLQSFTPDNAYKPNNHTIHYTSRLKVMDITDDVPNNSFDRKLNIEYGIDNQRFKQTYTDENNQSNTTWFTDGFERTEFANNQYKEINYIFAGDKLVAMNIATDVPNGGAGMHYVYTDYLGSLRCITNSAGVVEQKLGFDAWGNRRNPETGALIIAAPTGLLTPRGFTGHEHLDAFGLINMNGRVYDPAISMFLSPDPYIQAPTMTQNFNRYSYCLNNPLMYTDPSGEWFTADDLIAAGAGFAFNYVAYGIKHGDWGGNALKAGAVGALTAWLGWNTGGASVGLSQFIGNMAINTAASYIIPPINIPISSNSSISISPSFMLGSNGLGFGMNVSGNYNINLGNGYSMNLGVSLTGMDNAASTGTGLAGSLFTLGGGASISKGEYALGLYSTNFSSSDGTSQRVGGMSAKAGKFSFRYENDGALPFQHTGLGDGGDAYRTAALQLGWDDYSLGFSLFTGDYKTAKNKVGGDGRMKAGYYAGGNVDDFRLGALYVGYGEYRAGVNSENVRDFIQNQTIHNSHLFCGKQLLAGFTRKNTDWNPYFNYQTRNTYTLW